MLLAMDVGNSNIVLGLYPAAPEPAAPEIPGPRYASEIVAQWRISTPESRTTDEFGEVADQ